MNLYLDQEQCLCQLFSSRGFLATHLREDEGQFRLPLYDLTKRSIVQNVRIKGRLLHYWFQKIIGGIRLITAHQEQNKTIGQPLILTMHNPWKKNGSDGAADAIQSNTKYSFDKTIRPFHERHLVSTDGGHFFLSFGSSGPLEGVWGAL